MPQYRALRAFGIEGKGKYGHVRQGMVITMPKADADAHNRVHPKDRPILVPYVEPLIQDALEPEKNASLEGAPQLSGIEENEGNEEDEGNEDGEGTDGASQPDDQAPSVNVRDGRRAGGSTRRSSVSRPGRASRKRT